MKNFIGHPKTGKIEAVDGDPGTGLYSYVYDDSNITRNDIRQILSISEIILGDLSETKLIMEPSGKDEAELILSIRHRKNILLGTVNF